jgi:hypothetical protein
MEHALWLRIAEATPRSSTCIRTVFTRRVVTRFGRVCVYQEVEHPKGIEPLPDRWRRPVLPLNYGHTGATGENRTRCLMLTKQPHILMCFRGMEPPAGVKPATFAIPKQRSID